MTSQEKTNLALAEKVMEELMTETIATFFRLRAMGQQIGAVTPNGSGYWGLMRSLKQEGVQTVPQLARSRPVSRQHIQKLANHMIAEGVIELVNNPAHKRSKLLRLTSKGETVFQELNQQIAKVAINLAEDMDVQELQIAVKVLKQIREKLKDIPSDSEYID